MFFGRFVWTMALATTLLLVVSPGSAQSPTGSSSPAETGTKPLPPVSTGPEVGQKIPPFHLPDQNGRMQDLKSVIGPKGAMVVMFRSADW